MVREGGNLAAVLVLDSSLYIFLGILICPRALSNLPSFLSAFMTNVSFSISV